MHLAFLKSFNYKLLSANLNIFVLGCLFVFFIYHITIYFQNKDKLFLYYSIYVILLFFFFSFYSGYLKRGIYAKIATFLEYPIQPIFWIFYILFLKEVLELKKYMLKWNKILSKIIKIFLAFSIGFILIKIFATKYIYQLFILITGIIIILIAIVNNILIYKNIKTKIANYFLIGTTLFLVFSCLSVVFSIKHKITGVTPNLRAISYMQVGAVIEILLFSFIVAYKTKLDRDKKEELKKLYHIQLNQINSLQERIALNLKINKDNKNENLYNLEHINSVSKNNLTKREFEILQLISKGNSNNEIVEKLFISLNTVKYHLRNIYEKLDVKNRIEASQFFNKI